MLVGWLFFFKVALQTGNNASFRTCRRLSTSSSSCSEAEDEVECGREEPETVSDSGPPESETESTVQLPNETPIQVTVVSKPVLTDIGTYYRAGADGLVH